MERRIGVLINPSSGKGRVSQHAQEVLRGLAAAGDHVVAIQGETEAHARDLIDSAIQQGLDTLVAVGGDGTVHMALQAVVGSTTALGIVPLGTGNDAATSLGVPKDLAAAVAAIVAGHQRSFDVGEVTTSDDRRAYFLCVLSTGFDSLVNERANQMTRPSGDSRYVLALLAELRQFRPIPYTVEMDDQMLTDDAMIVSFGNGPSFGGGMLVCPNADLHDGRLSMIWVRRLSRPRLLKLFPSIYSGRHIEHPEVSETQVGTVRVSAPGGLAYADGERIGPLPATVGTVRDGVRVHVPR